MASAIGLAVRALVWTAGAIATLLLLSSLVITVYAVVMRYVFNAPLLWSDELTGYLLVALVMLGAAEAYRKGDHIGVDLLSSKARGRLKRLLAGFAHVAVLAVSVVIGYSAWESVLFARAFGSFSPGALEIETWIPQAPMILGAALLGVTALARLLGLLKAPDAP